MQREVRGNAVDHELGERRREAGERLRAGRTVREHLREQRLVLDRDRVADLERRLDPNAEPARARETRGRVRAATARRPRPRHGPGTRRRARAPSRSSASRSSGSPAAARMPFLHEIDPGQHLGHGVLDLDARVHLDEIEVAVGIDEELDAADVGVADRGRGLDRGVGEPARGARVEIRSPDPRRSASGDRAARSNRARRDGRRADRDRRRSAPRRGARARDSARRRRGCCRRRARPRPAPPRRPPPARRDRARRRARDRRRPRPLSPGSDSRCASATVRASARSASGSGLPGSTRTPAFSTMRRARGLSPMRRRWRTRGPMNASPERSQASAKSPFSASRP